MVEINWGLYQPDKAMAMFERGAQIGQQLRRSQDTREKDNALSAYAQNPEDNGAFNEFARTNPEAAMAERARREQQQQAGAVKQREEHQNQTLIMGKLLNNATDPQSYQQSLAAARQYGLDVSQAPAQYDPAWVEQQKMIVGAFDKDGGERISGLARELQDAGYQPGTPEFNKAMRGVISNKYASEYVDDRGQTMRRSALDLGGQTAPNEAISELQANPGLAPQFDEIFGPGAAARALGGGVSNGTGGFRP